MLLVQKQNTVYTYTALLFIAAVRIWGGAWMTWTLWSRWTQWTLRKIIDTMD